MCSALTALSSAGFWVSVAAGGRWLPREALRRAGARQVPADGAPGGGGTWRGNDGGAIVITAAPGHDVGSSCAAFTPPVDNSMSRMDRERFPRAVRLMRVGKASIFSQFLRFPLEDANREAACVRVFAAHRLQN